MHTECWQCLLCRSSRFGGFECNLRVDGVGLPVDVCVLFVAPGRHRLCCVLVCRCGVAGGDGVKRKGE